MTTVIFEQTIPQIFGIDPILRDENNPRFKPGLLYDVGRTWVVIFKKFLIPSSVAYGMHEGDGKEPVCDAEGKRLIRPSDLPIYGDECYVCDGKPCDDPCALEAQIGHLRKELWVWVDKYKGYRSKVIEVCATGKVHAESLLESLREESNYMPRAGAIGLSGLAGVVFGLRGGIVRKLTYGTAGAGAMAAVCYPREASEYTQEALHFMKKYVQIAYNFVYGVKPDYIRLPEPSTFMRSIQGADVSKSSSSADHVLGRHPPPPPPPGAVRTDDEPLPEVGNAPSAEELIEKAHAESLATKCYCPDPAHAGHSKCPAESLATKCYCPDPAHPGHPKCPPESELS